MQSTTQHTEQKESGKCTLSNYLTQRLLQAGVKVCFAVPGDYNMKLLSEISKEDRLHLVHCCNELNAGYAADGYSRASNTMTVVFVTFMVGSLSILNAIAGSFAEDVPVLVIVGSPNIFDRQCGHLVHHSAGDSNFSRSARCFEPVTAGTYSIMHIGKATRYIDLSIKHCLTSRKPVYLEIPCNLVNQHVQCFPQPVQFQSLVPTTPPSDETSLSTAIDAIQAKLQQSSKVLVVAGPKLRTAGALDDFYVFMGKLGCGVVVTPDAKGLVNEHDKNFIGVHWGSLSTKLVSTAVETADLIIYCGPVLNDYTTVGWTSEINYDKSVIISMDHVHVAHDRFSFIFLGSVLKCLSSVVKRKGNFMQEHIGRPIDSGRKDFDLRGNLQMSYLQDELQLAVGSGKYSAVITETGDSWFIAEKLKIPPDTTFHIQMQYCSIGWALPASLGVGLMTRENGFGKVLVLVGDGSFQSSAQELSTILYENVDITFVLINNGCYGIEENICSGKYNELANWQYSKMIDVFGGGEPQSRSFRATTNGELKEALEISYDRHGVALIECCLDRRECTPELRDWGRKVAAANCREEP